MPKIHSIYIASQAGELMNKREGARLIVGAGIEGDRYALGIGAFSGSIPAKVRDVSLIALAGIEDANQELEASGLKAYLPSEVRRNIVIEGMSSDALNQLIGKEFSLGFIRLRATELCIPCERPAKLSEKLNFLSAFTNRGGIRAQILDSGDIKVGDQLS
ncbi:sulfurase [Polynucleobacter campilacus]|uniref:Sulfurase n=2 Tax=Polynucleobacter campilacus TaxID=1743163 RepID=A0A254PU05_9BURK|nr:sulfurase [Polynucleobacter campilacus]